MNMDAYHYLEVSLTDGIALVVMTDPVGPDFVEREHPMHRELCSIWSDLAAADEVSAVVVTGANGTFFQGPTLEALYDLVIDKPHVVLRQMAEVRTMGERLVAFEKPVVAAVDGPALSMGCQLAFLSDEAIATPRARFQDTHVRLGLAAGDGGTWMWPLLIGYANARRFLLRSHPLSAQQALQMGLISDVVTVDELIPKATEIASKLRSLPPQAYRATKRALAQWLRLGSLLSADLSSAVQTTSYLTPEFKEMLTLRLARGMG
jgi:enoyl-CoA hydratase